ncbi:MAG TPA: hypothetical protein DCP96_00245 [Lachnospiraceae bacterium]|jgi:hypothetical protein|nr:hypothetical protein [Lachnospiraceae bacterium]MDD6148858.1 hypothetical protein [Lachnospiraceae bacterium]MDY5703360.1 hypothetical protein [Lachnospiraceae bacterium]MEE3356571.1 hypothetical protein [Lachnospiraceae bacterium]HAN50110.1 hypothetical protein [Lachnospiraceae bacterium]
MRRNTRELNYRKEEKRQRFFFLLRISLYLAVIVYFALAFVVLSTRNQARARETLQKAVEQDLTAYYAREGYYPKDLKALEENYGLTYDKDVFHVKYVIRGENIRPYVTIIEKGEK